MDTDDLGYLLHRAARRFRGELAASLRDLGLTPLQAAALIALAAEGHLPLTALADAVDADAPTVTGLVQRLERDGWVTTERAATDARSRIVRPSARTLRVLPDLLTTAEAASGRASAGLTADERSQLAALLRRLLEEGSR